MTQEEATAEVGEVQFEINDTTLVYDFNKLTMAQMKMAEAIYGYQADLEKKPARTLQEKVMLGGADYDQVVLSHLLLRRLKDGSLEKYKGGETQRRILDLVNEMPATQVPKAEEVIRDFFAKRGRYTLVLLVQQKYDLIYAQQLAAKIMQAQIGLQSDASSSNGSSDSNDSTSQASATDESSNA
jgi:hypothetical protein